ncbi:MAG TPA: PAS domain-containing protein [Terriglobia bacterium]|nr:PAS domain-containing protein [Terriglobia bacterium]
MTGFAFATADVLIEIDDSGRITWAGGALQSIFRKSASELVGQELSGEMTPAAAGQFDVMMRRLRQGGRVRDADLALEALNDHPRSAICVAMHRPAAIASGHYYLSVALSKRPAAIATVGLPHDNLTGLLELSGFVDLAKASVQRAQENGLSLNLTLIEMVQREQLETMLGRDRTADLLHEMGGELRHYSIGHETASVIGDGKFGIAHLDPDNISGLKSSVARLCEAYDIDDKMLKLDTRTIEFGSAVLSGDDISNILTFVWDKFRDEGIHQVEGISAIAYLKQIADRRHGTTRSVYQSRREHVGALVAQ